MNKLGLYLLKYWNGNLTLKEAFLYVFIPITVGWWFLKSLLKEVIPGDPVSVFSYLVVIPFLIGFSFAIYRFVGLWRCSINTNSKVLNYGAKAVALIMIIPAFLGAVLVLRAWIAF